MISKEDERVPLCSVEEWEAGSIRVARVVVEIDATSPVHTLQHSAGKNGRLGGGAL
jgi:hypothetical protein